MDKMTKTTACQLYEIVEKLPSEEKNKIPSKIILLINEKKEGYKLSENIFSIDDISLTEESKKYLAYIFLNYLANEEEKKEYENIISENEKKYQEILSEKYSVENLFLKKEIKDDENTEKTIDLITIENKKWWESFIEKIREFFKSKIKK